MELPAGRPWSLGTLWKTPWRTRWKPGTAPAAAGGDLRADQPCRPGQDNMDDRNLNEVTGSAPEYQKAATDGGRRWRRWQRPGGQAQLLAALVLI